MAYSRNLPEFTTQTATEYKTAIDQSIAGIDHVVGSLAANQTSPASMEVYVDAAYLPSGEPVGPWSVGGIGLPTSDPRVDVLYFNPNNNEIERVLGAEGPSPSWPSIPSGVMPVASILLSPSDTAITDEMITDIRSIYVAPAAQISNGYTNIVDPDGLDRMIIGRQGHDNRTIFRLHSGGSFVIQSSDGTTVAEIDPSGNLLLKGNVYEDGSMP